MNKVEHITFHFTRNEIDDCILRAAEIVKEGYTVEHIEYHGDTISTCKNNTEFYMTLGRKFDNE